MATLLAMGQFEAMIRFDANLRNCTKFKVYNHPATDNDSLAVAYIEVKDGIGEMLAVTRLNTTVIPIAPDMMETLIKDLGTNHNKIFDNGLIAMTARSERFTEEFTKLIKQSPLEALRRILLDEEGYDFEYQSYNNPDAINTSDNLTLLQAADWIRMNQAQTRTYIHFTLDGNEFVVLGRQFREESFLMLTAYNKSTQIAHFDGMVSGRPIHQRVCLSDNFIGDKTFIEHYDKVNVGHGDVDNKLWRIRHLGVHVASDGNVFIRGPHIAGRNPLTIPSSEDHDFTENRIIIL